MGSERVADKIERRFTQTVVRFIERKEHVEHRVLLIASEERAVSTSYKNYESEEIDESN